VYLLTKYSVFAPQILSYFYKSLISSRLLNRSKLAYLGARKTLFEKPRFSRRLLSGKFAGVQKKEGI